MAKLVSDLSGDLRKQVFYHFEVMYDDRPIIGTPTNEWFVAPRVPTNDTLIDAGKPYYLHLEDRPRDEELVEVKDCPADARHVTLRYFMTLHAELAGDVRIAQFVPTSPRLFCAVSKEIHARLELLNIGGARLNPIEIDDEFHKLQGKVVRLWHFQFVGRIRARPWKLLDAPNLCPHCGSGKLFCESCGYRIPLCENCGQEMYVIEHNHKGAGDKRIPFERDQKTVLEGKTWDGSDLVQGCYASKRFIDWLLRIHAAPFYAEPIYFCVDGMSDQQWRWFEDLQKPFEV